MREKYNKFIKKYGYKGFLYLFLHPLLILPLNIYALIGSLYNIIKALNKYEWKYLSGNTVLTALNNYFYYIQDLNIQRFGRYGISNLLAGGYFSLKTWFHTMPTALRFQSSFGTVFMLFFAMCVWIVSWFFIIDYNLSNFIILFIAIFSTYFFANFIDGQNYNVLAWMFLPIAFFALFGKNYLLYGLIIFIMSFLSFTAIFIFGIISFVFAIYWQDYLVFIATIPAIIKALIPVIVSLREDAIRKVGKIIGIFNSKVKYQRSDKKIGIVFLYFLFLNIIFILNYYIRFGIDNYFILQVTILLLFIINYTISRFADSETLWIFFLTIYVFSLINKNLNTIDYIILYFSINPVYVFLGYGSKNSITPDIRNPYNTKKLINHIINMLSKVEPNQKVWFVFKNPNNQYSSIFDGYRQIIEPFEYCANKLNLVLFPDWYYIFEHNDYEKDNDIIWFDNIQNFEDKLKALKVKYFISYMDIKISNTKKIGQLEINGIFNNNFEIKLYKVVNDNNN